MRLELLWRPDLACARLAYKLRQKRRLKCLRGTVAQGLAVGHIDSLELLQSLAGRDIRSIYDVGANMGTWTLLAKAVIPQSAIDAFEPLEAHVTEFRERTAAVEGIRVHTVALGSTNTRTALRVTDFTDASSLLPLTVASKSEHGLAEVDQIEVIVRRLDEYRVERELPLPDLIKLDVQGFELEVLRGAEQCLTHASAVVLEVSFVEYYENQCLFHDIVTFLAKHGLYLSVFGEHTPVGMSLKQTDALFTRPLN